MYNGAVARTCTPRPCSATDPPCRCTNYFECLIHRRENHDVACLTSAANTGFLFAEFPIWCGPPGRLIRPMRRHSKAACDFLSAQTSGYHPVQHAANALVQTGPPVPHGAAPHQFRGAVRVRRHLKAPGFPGRLPAVLQPGARQAVPAGHLSRDLIDAPRTMVTTLHILDIMSIPFSTVGVHMICKLLRMCEDLHTHILINNWIDVAKTDERADAPCRAPMPTQDSSPRPVCDCQVLLRVG
ncbi:hypothetical protein MTO96_013798 [Rhipicephalus appendiculatus]